MAAKPNEIQITRVYDAPVRLVWEVWTDLKHVEKWWGPRGFTLTTKSKDLRPGGKWIYTMHGPDGTDYPNIATYHEVVPYEKLVYDHGGNEEREKLFTVTATFREEGGRTTLTMTFALDNEEAAKAMKQFIKAASGNSTWDRLAEYLDEGKDGKAVFHIHRSFEAPPSRVFPMWAKPAKLALWLGPKGAKTSFPPEDFREGGHAQWTMTVAGSTKQGQLHHQLIAPNHKLVYSQNFCDAEGRLIKAPFATTYPDQLLTTVIFTEEDGGTRVSVKWEILGKATAEEIETFRSMRSVMTQGWGESFDVLDEQLR